MCVLWQRSERISHLGKSILINILNRALRKAVLVFILSAADQRGESDLLRSVEFNSKRFKAAVFKLMD